MYVRKTDEVVQQDFQVPTHERNVVAAGKGVAVTFGGRLLGLFERFVLGLLLARFLGAEQYGLYSLALSVAAIASTLAVLGLDTGLVRYVAAFVARRDPAGLSAALRIGMGVPLVLSSVCGLVLIALADAIAEQWFHEPRLVPLLRMVGLVVPFIALNEVIAAATRGFKNQHYTVIAKFIYQPAVKIVALVVLVAVGLNAQLAAVAFMLAEVATFALLVYFLNKQFSLRRLLGAGSVNLREILTFSLAVYLAQAVTALSGNIQAVVLATSGTVAAVGIYVVADQASTLSRLVNSSVMTVSMPFISELSEQRDRKQLERFYQTTTRWTFMLNLPMFLVVVMFPDAILGIFGKSFVDGAPALAVLAWASLAITATGTNGALLDMSGYTKLKFVNSVFTAIATIGLNILLVPRMGVMGAAWATLAGTVILEASRLIEVYVLLRVIPYNASFLKPIVAALAAFSAGWVLGYLLPYLDTYPRVLVQGAAIMAAYLGAILKLGLSPEDRMILNRLYGRVRRS